MTRTRALRRAAAPALLAALTLGLAAPASADGAGPGPGQGGQATAEIVTGTKLQGNVAALTFDDGPNPVDTPRLLEVLRQNDVKARRRASMSGPLSPGTNTTPEPATDRPWRLAPSPLLGPSWSATTATR